MPSAAFYDGRKSGYYGNVKSANPYRKGWARHGIGDQLTYAEEWDRGFDEGLFLHIAERGGLMLSLDRLGTLIKAKSCA